MTNRIHKCKIHCHTIDPETLDAMGLDSDVGKWMPFSFHMETVLACKLASDDEEVLPFGCTTIFTDNGDTYIIDTPYEEFEEIFCRYYNNDAATTSSKEVNL